jgi:hypothetical protein
MRPGGHRHPANQRRHDQRTRSEVLADRVTAVFGSWTFIIVQTMIVVLWIGLNLLALVHRWGSVPVHPAEPGLLHTGGLRRPADPAQPEPAGRHRPDQGRARLPGQPDGPAVPDDLAPRRARPRLRLRRAGRTRWRGRRRQPRHGSSHQRSRGRRVARGHGASCASSSALRSHAMQHTDLGPVADALLHHTQCAVAIIPGGE